MVRYRPLSPNAAWRDQKVFELGQAGRFLEIYLITSTFANVIGCYRLVSSVAAAELGMTADEFQVAADQLEAHEFIDRYDGYFLVRRWFQHHLWESTLKGNVIKRAAQELALLPSCLQEKWVESCLVAGAPSEFVEAIFKPLIGRSEGASEVLAHFNNNITEHQELQQKSTATTVAEKAAQLILSSRVEPFRALLEKATVELDQSLAQQIADEISGIWDAAEAGKRPAIGSIKSWLIAVVENAKLGLFVPQWGLPIALQRMSDSALDAKHKADAVGQKKQKQAMDDVVRIAEQTLQEMSPDVLDELMTNISTAFKGRSVKASILKELELRKVPRGPGCSEVLAAMKDLSEEDINGCAI